MDQEKTIRLSLFAGCKYGENAHQIPAALYTTGQDDPLALDKFKLVAGTEPSYNNYGDVDRLLQTVTHIAATFDLNYAKVPYIAVGAKHGNACGASISYLDRFETIKKMVTGDLQALFGGLVMVNFPIGVDEAELLLTYKSDSRRILDGIIAPVFSAEAIEMLKRKGDKCRFIVNPALAELGLDSLDTAPIFRYARGGALIQPNYTYILNLQDPDLKQYGPGIRTRSSKEYNILLAKAICDTSNSNTITIVSGLQLLANGVGQQSRVNGAELAVRLAAKNWHNLHGAVAASDSFFPFIDGPKVLVNVGIKAIISTSGSVRDAEVIDFCKENNVAIYLIPDTKGRGFFNH